MDDRRPGSERGSVWSGVLLTLSVLVAIFVIVALFASARRGTARRGWEETLGTAEQVFQRHPSRPANRSAIELERLTAALAIDLVPRWQKQRPRLVSSRHDRLGKVDFRGLGQWVDEQLVDDGPAIAAPPAAVEAYLAERHEAIVAVREHLLRHETPRWELELEQLFAAPVPNLLGVIELHKVLVADAMRAIRLGDPATAEESLRGSWRLVDALADDPMLICQIVVVGLARRTSGALRRLDDPPADWSSRLRSHDFRESLMNSMLVESWVLSRHDGSDVSGGQPVFEATLRRFIAPYYRLCMADVSERARRQLVRLQAVDPSCDTDPARVGIDLSIDVPAWNAFGAMAVSGHGDLVERVQRLRVDLELTSRIVELHDARRGNGGKWPAALPGGDRSEACPHDRWVYRTEGTEATLALGRELRWSEKGRGVRLPTRWTSR